MADCRLKRNSGLSQCKRSNPKKLNCWKKVENKKYFKTFYKEKDSKNIWVFSNDKKNWMVDLDDSKKPIKRFTTETKALKYTNNYIKKHDKC